MLDKPKFGPWAQPEALMDLNEYRCQLRSLQTLVYIFRLENWPISELLLLLRKAEFCTDYLEPARDKFDALPSLLQRKIISTFHNVNNGDIKKPLGGAKEPQ